ncbi:MAG: alpha/beta hydrolase [Kangiellaceae bacterium]|nr:alpha/beta hydrolase [Kangiellaceae bacterium]
MSSLSIAISDTQSEQINQTEDNQYFRRIPFWLNEDSDVMFCWLHLPIKNEISKTGVIICSPLGYEYSHTHRTVRHLSDQLASNNYATIRFDYSGTGDSASDLFAKDRIESFNDNIGSVIELLKEKLGIQKICLIGIRLGGTFAARYSHYSSVDQLILWSCYTKGRTYIRETKALERLASHSVKQVKNFIDSGGFIITIEAEKTLNEINLLKQTYQVKENVLIIERDDLTPNEKLLQYISNQKISVEMYLMSNYLEMMAEPHETKVPKDTLNHIATWIGAYDSPISLALTDKQVNWFSNRKHVSFNNISETICRQPMSKLMGILSVSKEGKNKQSDKTLILLANSGSVHRVGPNRVYVELARAAAEAGHSVLRFDLGNLGDSVQVTQPNENDPYPLHATADIAQTIGFMKRAHGFEKFVLAGLCSGAYSVFHAGLKLPSHCNIQEVIMINLLSIYRSQNNSNSISYDIEKTSVQYSESLTSLAKWKKLFTGKVNLLKITKFSLIKLQKAISQKLRNTGEHLKIYRGSQLTRDIKAYQKNSIRLNFFIASRDPGKEILMSQSKKTLIKNQKNNSDSLRIVEVPNADHTFSEYYCRKNFISLFVDHLDKSRKRT